MLHLVLSVLRNFQMIFLIYNIQLYTFDHKINQRPQNNDREITHGKLYLKKTGLLNKDSRNWSEKDTGLKTKHGTKQDEIEMTKDLKILEALRKMANTNIRLEKSSHQIISFAVRMTDI